ncbi:hypothetical protein [Streptacidiphilus sp. PAMC 29251]
MSGIGDVGAAGDEGSGSAPWDRGFRLAYQLALDLAHRADPTAEILRGDWWNYVVIAPRECPFNQWAYRQGLLLPAGGDLALPFHGSYTQVRALMRGLVTFMPPGGAESYLDQVGHEPPAEWFRRTRELNGPQPG